MIRSLLFVLFASLVGTASAQVSVDHATISDTIPPAAGINFIYFHVTNDDTLNTHQLVWSFSVEPGYPANWVTQLCDNNLCYGAQITTCPPNNPNVFTAGSTHEWKFQLNPSDFGGLGTINLNIQDATAPTVNLASVAVTVFSDGPQGPPVGIDAVEEATFGLYPNPANETATVQLGDDHVGAATVQLFDPAGRLVQAHALMAGLKKVNLYTADLAPGMYLVHIASETGTQQKQLVIQ